MGIPSRIAGGLIATLLCLPFMAIAQDRFEILHAERIALRPGTAASTAELKARPADVNLRFSAYGREFDLQLEGNDRLLANLPAPQKASLLGYRMYRGTLRNRPGSWVRLTRTPTGDYGAVWDGEEFYTLSPAAVVGRSLAQPVAAQPNETLIYREVDTNAAQGQAFCAITDPAAGTTQSSPVGSSYKSLVGELQGTFSQATDLRGQIELALIGDNEFVARNPVDPQAALLARLNIADGILSTQAGVTLLATQFELFPGTADPFTSKAPSTLLDQLASYRESTPAVRSRGLAHLVTGTNLDGNTVGMAYLSALCQPRFGVSLSEDRGSSISISALIMAHEIGHNFGAPHDGEAGACSATPQSFLMSPSLNGSPTFSACSLSEMQSRIQAASCIAPASSFADVSVTNTPSSPRGIAQREFLFTAEVSSPGTLPAKNVVSHLRIPSGFNITRSPSGQQCTLSGDLYSCSLGDIAPGASQAVQVWLQAQQPGVFGSLISVTADNDRYSANSSQNIAFTIVQGSDGFARFAPPSASILARTPFDIDLVVETTGNELLANSSVVLDVGFLGATNVSSDLGTCALNGQSATCTVGNVPPPRTITVRIRASAPYAGTFPIHGYFTSAGDSIPSNNGDSLQVVVLPKSDVALQMDNTLPPVAIGVPFSNTLHVLSAASQASDNVVVRIAGSNGLVLDSVVTSPGTCTSDGSGFSCILGTIPAGQSRNIGITAHGTDVGSLRLLAALESATFDDDRNNNSGVAAVDVRRDRDAGLLQPSGSWGYDTTDFAAAVPVESIGMNAVNNAVITATLPGALTVKSAVLQGAACTISGNVVTCNASQLPAGYQGNLILVLNGNQTGIYSANATLAATNDGYAGNNSQTFQVEVRPFIDTSVRFMSPPSAVTIGETFPLQIAISQNRNAAIDAGFRAEWDSSLQLVSIQSSFTNCFSNGTVMGCNIGTMTAGSTANVTLTMRATSRNQVYLTAFTYAQSPNGSSNNLASFQAFADRQGDAGVVVPASITVLTGLLNNLPPLTVTATRAIDEAIVDIEFTGSNAAQINNVSMSSNGYCSRAAGTTWNCGIGALGNGESRQIALQVIASSAGSSTATATLRSPNDTNPGNNTGSWIVTFNAPTTTPSPATPSSSSGGGGGGAFDPRWLVLLIALAAWRQRLHFQRCSARSQNTQ